MSKPGFLRVGTFFGIDGTACLGSAILSPAAAYFVVAEVRNPTAEGMGAAGGAIGGLLGSALPTPTLRRSNLFRTCKLAQLGPAVLGHPDWPRRESPAKHGDRQVVVVKRGSVKLIEHPRFCNTVCFKVGTIAFNMTYLVLRGPGVRDYLVDAGWPVLWAGKRMGAGAA